ncbi:MAG: hypothetical protein HQ567_33510 [Candidatus Nealsonbacteria bacterium]|nr:hypothetical protein [Candidatus Nealsonbacteria bacterium]
MKTSENRPDPRAYIADGAVVHATAQVHAGAWIASRTELGPGVIVGPGAVIGFGHPENAAGSVKIAEHAFIGAGAHIEPGVHVGPDAEIQSGSILRTGTRIGTGAHVGPRCVLMGHCDVQEYASLYAEVHVCEHATLHPHCQLAPGVKLLNDSCPPTQLDVRGPTIGRCAVIGVNAVIWLGVRVGSHAIVATASVVRNDVPDYTLVRGAPAKPICDTRRIRLRLGDRWVYPYPWTRHVIEGEDVSKPAP